MDSAYTESVLEGLIGSYGPPYMGRDGRPLSHHAADIISELRASLQEAERRAEGMEKLAQAASNDAERAIQRARKAETDLRCLQESTVDVKAYEQLKDTLASANEMNERLVAVVREARALGGRDDTPTAREIGHKARALLADMGKGDGG